MSGVFLSPEFSETATKIASNETNNLTTGPEPFKLPLERVHVEISTQIITHLDLLRRCSDGVAVGSHT